MNSLHIMLPNGNKVSLSPTFTSVYMVDKNGNRVWETQCNDLEFERSFTNPYFENGSLWVGTTVGVEYQLDIDTGAILNKVYRK